MDRNLTIILLTVFVTGLLGGAAGYFFDPESRARDPAVKRHALLRALILGWAGAASTGLFLRLLPGNRNIIGPEAFTSPTASEEYYVLVGACLVMALAAPRLLKWLPDRLIQADGSHGDGRRQEEQERGPETLQPFTASDHVYESPTRAEPPGIRPDPLMDRPRPPSVLAERAVPPPGEDGAAERPVPPLGSDWGAREPVAPRPGHDWAADRPVPPPGSDWEAREPVAPRSGHDWPADRPVPPPGSDSRGDEPVAPRPGQDWAADPAVPPAPSRPGAASRPEPPGWTPPTSGQLPDEEQEIDAAGPVPAPAPGVPTSPGELGSDELTVLRAVAMKTRRNSWRIADETGLDRDTVKRLLNLLTHRGLVICDRNPATGELSWRMADAGWQRLTH